MSPEHVDFSFLLPTRNRVGELTALLDSVKTMTARPERLEIVLGIDENDAATRAVSCAGLNIKKIVIPPGQTMGLMNRACYEASSGRHVMLMNDDMLLRTPNWDAIVAQTLAPLTDGIFLVHLNDLIFSERLCCFPMLSRKFCEMVGGVCPPCYERYRIDDHIYNLFNMLAVAGHKRIFYFPDVVFEHLNFEAKGAAGREYIYNKEILARDARRFEEGLAERKALVAQLADHIDACRSAENARARGQILTTIGDCYSIRRPEYVRAVATRRQTDAFGVRATVALVCSDLRRPHTQTCLNLIKAHTPNCELIVLDNGNDPGFNHAREMNRLMEFCKHDQLVLLDDDVLVEPGWLEDMQAALTGDIGCVTPVHKDASGKISYAGVYVGLDERGDHGHLLGVPAKSAAVPTVCSAAMLIDMRRIGHLRFDEGCLKYFHDLDFGLKVWEAGSACACSRDVPVTHLAGATLKQGSPAAHSYWERDRQVFIERWLLGGRLRRLREQRWRDVPELDTLYDVSEEFVRLLTPEALSGSDWQTKIGALIAHSQKEPALRSTLVKEFNQTMVRFDRKGLESNSEPLQWLRASLNSGQSSAGEIDEMRRKIAPLVEAWRAQKLRVVVYPAGEHTASLLRWTNLLQANIVGFGDSNRLLEGEELWGKPVVSPAGLLDLQPDAILLSSKNFENEIHASLRTQLPENVKIIRLYTER